MIATQTPMSHPTRVRGLKLMAVMETAPRDLVAPHAGAWIETHAARWCALLLSPSHPTRVRGLKLPARLRREKDAPVAPLTGA